MLRVALIALLSGTVAESALFACSKLGGPNGSCGPDSTAAFVGLIGHVPTGIMEGLVGYDFTDAGVFAVNASLLALGFFFAGCFVLLVRASRGA